MTSLAKIGYQQKQNTESDDCEYTLVMRGSTRGGGGRVVDYDAISTRTSLLTMNCEAANGFTVIIRLSC